MIVSKNNISDEIDPFHLEKGDKFWESGQYGNFLAEIIDDPVISNTDIDGRRCITFRANGTRDGKTFEDIDYTITEGLEHYGARLYTDFMYGYIIDGEIKPWR